MDCNYWKQKNIIRVRYMIVNFEMVSVESMFVWKLNFNQFSKETFRLIKYNARVNFVMNHEMAMSVEALWTMELVSSTNSNFKW